MDKPFIISPNKINIEVAHGNKWGCKYEHLYFDVTRPPSSFKVGLLIEFPGHREFNTKIGENMHRVDIARGLETLLQNPKFKTFIFHRLFTFSS